MLKGFGYFHEIVKAKVTQIQLSRKKNAWDDEIESKNKALLEHKIK